MRCYLKFVFLVTQAGYDERALIQTLGEETLIQDFGTKPNRKQLTARTRSRWKDIIKMNFVQIRRNGFDCIRMAQGREKWQAIIDMRTNLRVPQNPGSSFT